MSNGGVILAALGGCAGGRYSRWCIILEHYLRDLSNRLRFMVGTQMLALERA